MIRKIYYLEDNEKMGILVKKHLSRIGNVCPVDISVYPDCASFFAALKDEPPHLIIIDLMLNNDEDGYEVLKEIKGTSEYKNIPVIIVSAKVGEYEKVSCIEAGAIVYFSKPFLSYQELVSSAKNFLEVGKDDRIVVCGDLVVDSSDHMVIRAGVEYKLMYKEFDLLKYFMLNRGITVTKEKIYKDIWNETVSKDSRSLDQYIKTLRKNLFSDIPDVIQTSRNVGYKFVYDIKK